MPYLRLFLAGFRRRMIYRLALVAGVVANAMFGVIRGAVLLAIAHSSGGMVAGYSAASLSTYNWLSQAFLGPVNLWGSNELSNRVRSGDIAVDLARPLDLQGGYLAADLGYAWAAVIPRSLPTLAIGALTFGVVLPGQPGVWALGILAFLLALIVSYLARFCLQLIAFWVIDIRGFVVVYAGVAGLLGGLILPVHFMPSWLQTVAYATPFPAMMQTPVDVLSGRVSGGAALAIVGRQALWIAILAVAGRVAMVLGSRRLVVQGG